MFKNRIYLFAITAVLLAFASCSKDDNLSPDPGPGPEPEPTPDPRSLVTYVKKNPVNYSFVSDTVYYVAGIYKKYEDQISELKEQMGIDVREVVNSYLKAKVPSSMNPALLLINKTVLNVESTDALGNKQLISGALFYSPLSDSLKDIIIESHITIGRDSQCPSKDGMENLISILTAVPNVIMTASDYIGYGVSKDKPHPYLLKDVTAQNQLDFFKAAVLYLDSEGFKFRTCDDSLSTYAVGASQGGEVSLSIQRKLESNSDFTELSGFKGSYCCDGPYDPWATFSYYLGLESIKMACVLPFTLLGFYQGGYEYLNKFPMQNFLSEKLQTINIFDTILTKKYTTTEITRIMDDLCGGKSPQKLLAPEMFDPTSEMYKAFQRAAAENNLADGTWSPVKLSVFHHSYFDEVVPYDNFESIQSVFPEGSYVESPLTLNLPNHPAECGWFYVTFLEDCWKVDEYFGKE